MSLRLLSLAALALLAADAAAADPERRLDALYNASDAVVALEAAHFKDRVHQSERAWLVEFYMSWCGTCQRYAPVWKAVAESVHGEAV